MSLRSTDLLDEFEWIPHPRRTQLRRLGLETVGDLLTHYPRRHEDRRAFGEFPREESEQPICLCGEVTRTRLNRFGRGKKIFEVTLQETNPHALSQQPDWPALGRFRQAASARSAHLHGTSGIRNYRERRRNFYSFPAYHAHLPGD